MLVWNPYSPKQIVVTEILATSLPNGITPTTANAIASVPCASHGVLQISNHFGDVVSSRYRIVDNFSNITLILLPEVCIPTSRA